MNKEESLALYEQGQEAWNAWAEKMLAEKAVRKERGRWQAREKDWADTACANFKGHTFDGIGIEFSGFIFPGDACFNGAAFPMDVWFIDTAFSGGTWFDGAKFSRDADFVGAAFSGYADFGGAVFSGHANFTQALFKGLTIFESAEFGNEADFLAMKAESYFTLERAAFKRAPDFEQARFAEAPRLDISSLPESNWREEKADLTAKWRALKRLAVQGHDYERERVFFAEEIKAARNVRDHPFGANYERYWAGLLYEIVSDFGRSMWRPFVGWWASVGLFALLYRIFQTTDDGTLWSAIYLAVRKGAIFAGRADAEKLAQHYGNLFGAAPVPDWVSYAGMVQTLLSAVWIFLFMLAVRNHFRIK